MPRLRRDRPTVSRVPRGALVLSTAALALALAACGSQLDPATVAQSGVVGTGAGDPGVPAGVSGAEAAGQPGGTVPGGTVPEAGGVPGGADPGTSGSEGGTTPAGSDSAQGEGENAADGGAKAGACDGFDNDQTGVSSDKITIANVADISGPVPGLFESAQQATRAYATYFNSANDICGHKLDVMALDSRADAGADQQAYVKACAEAFAAVGSVSSFDSGGAAAAADCELPDMRGLSVTPDRAACQTCFSAYALAPNLVPTALPKYFRSEFPDAVKHVALLYVNVGAAAVNAQSFNAGWSDSGLNIDYFEGIDTSEFNYSPYVQQMKDKGIEMVVYLGPYQFTVRLQQAMKQQGFEPDVFLQDQTIYDQRYVDEAGSAGEGSYVYSTTELLDDFNVEEMALYRSWLDQVSPGAVPNYYGLYAWSATRLFVEQAVALGGKLNRKTLVDALRKVRKWTGNGLHVPQEVGLKTTPPCLSVIRLTDGTWSQVSPGKYMCAPLIDTGIGD